VTRLEDLRNRYEAARDAATRLSEAGHCGKAAEYGARATELARQIKELSGSKTG
jgi:hypothetical protein